VPAYAANQAVNFAFQLHALHGEMEITLHNDVIASGLLCLKVMRGFKARTFRQILDEQPPFESVVLRFWQQRSRIASDYEVVP